METQNRIWIVLTTLLLIFVLASTFANAHPHGSSPTPTPTPTSTPDPFNLFDNLQSLMGSINHFILHVAELDLADINSFITGMNQHITQINEHLGQGVQIDLVSSVTNTDQINNIAGIEQVQGGVGVNLTQVIPQVVVSINETITLYQPHAGDEPGEDLDVITDPLPIDDGLPPLQEVKIFETTATPERLSASNYMATFFSNPVAKDLKLYVPGYAYFQGIVYSKGNITALGPIRVIGGIISKTPESSSEPKGISLNKGAMLTTDPEYLNRRTNPPQVRLRVTQWEEIPAALKSR